MFNSAQTPELQTSLAGQIARALAVFCVDEIVIYDDGQSPKGDGYDQQNGDYKSSYTGYSDPNYFLAHILSYLECPPYLRRALFPMHPDLRLAGSLPSLDMPHHLRKSEWCQYREGVTMTGKADVPAKKKGKSKGGVPGTQNLVNTGLDQDVFVEAMIPAITRLTLKFKQAEQNQTSRGDALLATPVAPSAPREEAGYYWGYAVRSAPSLSAVLTECPFEDGYDLSFGTSERGIDINQLDNPDQDRPVPQFNHMLMVFGGVAGLEVAVKADDELKRLGVETPEALFDYWVDLCPGQGSRTIRTEEAVWLGLMGLRNVVLTKGIV